jgi:hypothetical protein
MLDCSNKSSQFLRSNKCSISNFNDVLSQYVLLNFVLLLTLYSRYESYIDVEIQQRAVEYFELSRKGSALADVLAEMPKFPEREVTYMASYSCS